MSLGTRRAASLEDARDAFFSGHLSAALTLTRGDTSPFHALLRARTQMRLQANDAARATLASITADNLPHALAAEIALARVSCCARIGDRDAAEVALTDARAFAFSTGQRALEMDVYVHEAALRLMQGEPEETARIVDRVFALRRAPVDGFPTGPRTFWDEAHVAARAFELRAFVAGGRSNVDEQVRSLREAFAEARRSATPDLWLTANIASNCALVARESGRRDVLAELTAWSSGVAWPEDLALQRYHLESAFGLAFALENDQLRAFKAYRRAADIAPSPSWQVVAMLERIALARSVRAQSAFVLDELEAVREIAARIDWNRVAGESYVALLLLAQAVAPNDPDAAAGYLERYRTSHAASPRSLAGRFDPRRVAHEAFATGLIAAARGCESEAVAAYDRAYDEFANASFTWRAAMVAVERYAVRPDAASRSLAEASIAAFRESTLASRLCELIAELA